MRQLALGSVGRRISWLLVAALTLPLLVLATPPRRAYAQLTRIPAVAALDFGVIGKSKYRDILGRSATDAVVIEMSRSGKFDVAARTLVNQQLQDLGLKQPNTNNDIRRLGMAMGVDTIVSGDVLQVGFTDKPRRAQVTLSVRFTDVVSGELINGTIQSGYSGAAAPGQQSDDEALINQALTDAAANVIRTINNYTLPEATILFNNGTETVTLNRGARDGLKTGQEMIVTRGRDRVGKIRVAFVEATTSTATVLDYGKGIRPEDHARAIFQVPGYNVTEEGVISTSAPAVTSYTPTRSRATPILITALAIGAAVLLATFLFSRKSTTEEATGISKVSARAYAIGNFQSNTTIDTTPRVQVTWRAAADIAIPTIIEYHVYRDYQIVSVNTRTNTTFIDDPTLPAGTLVNYNTVSYGGGFPTNPATGTGTTTTTTTTGGNNNGGGNNGGGNNGAGGNGGGNNGGGNTTGNGLPQSQLNTVTATVTPLIVGVTHRYQVTIVYQAIQAVSTGNAGGTTTGGGGGGGGIGGGGGGGGIGGGGVGGGGGNVGGGNGGGGNGGGGNNGGGNNGGGGGGTTIVYRETALRATSGGATPIVRPSITGITDQGAAVDAQSGGAPLNNLGIAFQTIAGADQYVFEFSNDPSFRKKTTKGPFFFPASGTQVASQGFNLVSDFKSVPDGGLIFYRVGARNSVDDPGPLGIDTPNSGNYVYSGGTATIRVAPRPPNSP